MKAKGFVRKVDKLGRICLPIEFRREAGLKTDDKIEMIVTDEGLLMRKYEGGSRIDAALKRLKDAVGEDDRLGYQQQMRLLEKLDSMEFDIMEIIGEGKEDDT